MKNIKLLKAEKEMKSNQKISRQDQIDRLRETGSVVRDAESLGLCRGWEDILIAILDRRMERLAGITDAPGD